MERMFSTINLHKSHFYVQWGLRDILLMSTSANSELDPPTWTLTTWGLVKLLWVLTNQEWTQFWTTRLMPTSWDKKIGFSYIRDKITVLQVNTQLKSKFVATTWTLLPMSSYVNNQIVFWKYKLKFKLPIRFRYFIQTY